MPERLTAARDVDGDGVGDVYGSSYLLDVEAVRDVGRVYLFSGATRNLVRVLNHPDPEEGAHFGFYISVPGDVNGDSVEDITVGAESQDVNGNKDQGRAYVFDGRTGSLLFRLDDPNPQPGARFGSRLGAAGDVTGDGRADILVGATGQDLSEDRVDAGQVFVFSGSNGALVRSYETPREDLNCSPGCGNLGYSPQAIGDLNRDGVTDHMAAASLLRLEGTERQGRIYVFSGADGSVLTRIDQPDPGDTRSFFGLQDTDRFTPGDVTGDGVPEIYGSGFALDKNGLNSAGRAWVFDGARSLREGEGAVLYELPDPNPAAGKAFGFTVSRTNYNKDGVNDLFVSNLSNHERTDVPQEAYVFDGRDGSLLKLFKSPEREVPEGTDLGTGFGWSSRALGDINRDGEPDYAAAAPFSDVEGTQSAGRIFFILSQATPAPAQAPAPAPVSPPPPVASTCATEGSPGYLFPAKMRVRRVEVDRRQRVLDVFAPITSRAQGDVDVIFQSARRTTRFDAKVTEGAGVFDRIRFEKKITRAQAALGTGIVTLIYKGDANTRPEEVRLRAADRSPRLDVDRLSLVDGRLSARGSVSRRARGIVRFQYSYIDANGNPQIYPARARIRRDGKWRLSNDVVPPQVAKCGGYLSILFTGFFPEGFRGEQLAYQLNPGQVRRPTTRVVK